MGGRWRVEGEGRKVVAVYPGEAPEPIAFELPWGARYYSNWPRQPLREWRPEPRATIEVLVSDAPLVRLQSPLGTISRRLPNLSQDAGGVFYRDRDIGDLLPHGDAIDWRECEVAWPG